MAQVTKTAYPSGLVASQVTGSIQNQNNPVGKGSNNTTYAQAYIRTGSSATSYLTYGFDLSDIPDNAVINSVSCSAKGYISTTGSNAIRTRQMQMFSGDTAKGTASTISNTASVITMSVGTWTVAELKNARIRIYAVRGTSSTSSSVYLRFYGATLTVVYEYNDKRYLIKTGASQWSEVSKVYEKTSSGMVERSLETVMTAIQDGKKMRYRGVYEGIAQNLIQFTIQSSYTANKKTYNAELGMTWGEWCESPYNTEGFYTYRETDTLYICGGDDQYAYISTEIRTGSTAVDASDVIVTNKTYYGN